MASYKDFIKNTEDRIKRLKEEPSNVDAFEELEDDMNAIRRIVSDMKLYRSIEIMPKEELDPMYKEILTYSVSKTCEEYQEALQSKDNLDLESILSTTAKIRDIESYINNVNSLDLDEAELREFLASILVSDETREVLKGKNVKEVKKEIEEVKETIQTSEEKDFYDVLKLALADLKDSDEYNAIVALRQRQEDELKTVAEKQAKIKADRDRVNDALQKTNDGDMSEEDYDKLKELAAEFPYDPDKVVQELEQTYGINLGWFKKSNAKPIVDKITSFIEYKERESKLQERIEKLPDIDEIRSNQLKSRNEKSIPLYEKLRDRLTEEGFGDYKYIYQIEMDEGDYLDKLSSLDLRIDSLKRTFNNYENDLEEVDKPMSDDAFSEKVEIAKASFGK